MGHGEFAYVALTQDMVNALKRAILLVERELISNSSGDSWQE